jgi:type IV pilus assembly protein PilB
MDNHLVIDLFTSRGMIDGPLGQDMLNEVEQSGKDITEILADYQVVNSRDDVWSVIASELGCEEVDITKFTPPAELLALLPAGMARMHGALPLTFSAEGITVALVDPLNPQTAEDLQFSLGK